MITKNGNLPAIPVWCSNSDQQLYGLTKREQLIVACIQGICANPNYKPLHDHQFNNAADEAIRQADSILNKWETS